MNSWLWLAGCVWSLGVFANNSMASQAPLSISSFGGEVSISWPLTGGYWRLEGSPTLSPAASWTGVIPSSDQTNGTVRRVVIVPGDTNRFFRLRRLDSGEAILTGRWQLDEGAGQVAQDSSGTGATLFTSSVNWTSGRTGNGALQFNGSGGAGGSRAWVSNSNHEVLPEANQPFSVSFWFSPDALTPGWRGLAGTDANGSGGWRVALSTTGPGTNYLVFAGSGAGTSLSVTGRTLLLPRQWYHLAATYDGSVGSIYLDGVRLASGTGAIPANDGPVYFGGGVGGYSSLLGRIDDIRTFANCLPGERVSLNGEWLFDEGPGSSANDSSGWGHHANLSDSSVRKPAHSGEGVDLSADELLIPNDYLDVLPSSGKPFSVSLWLRPNVLSPGRFGLMQTGVNGINGWQMAVEIGESSQPTLHVSSTSSGGTLDLSAAVDLIANTWSKVDVTFNGGVATVYCNGRKVRAGNGAIQGSRRPIIFGGVTGLANFPGLIDELRIYGRERGEGEIGPVAPVMWETALMSSVTNFTLRGAGPSGRPLTYTIVPTIVPTNGTVSIVPGSSTATYSAGARKGPDAFTYTVSDGEFTTAPSIVTVSVVEPHWLSPTGGSGGPRDGRSPSRAWAAGGARALDAILETNNFYDCFYYGPGVYETRGWKFGERHTANPGCKHVGSGSVGPDRTVLKLVDTWEAWTEGTIFGHLDSNNPFDGFEVHDMVLDCNAQNNPKYVTGEPVWIRIPLAAPATVSNVTLRWSANPVPGLVPLSWTGRATNFSVTALLSATNVYSTNWNPATATNQVSVVNLGVPADELLVELERRAPKVDLYGLSEIEVSGAAVSLPSARVPGGGESRLGKSYSIALAVDEDFGTSWASGLESEVQIELPFAPNTRISQLTFHWNCQNLAELGQLGPASAYFILRREEASGSYVDVPFVGHGRDASGMEMVTFGNSVSTNPVVTDRLVIVLVERAAPATHFSLREITFQDGIVMVRPRVPTAFNRFLNGSYSILRAFDRDDASEWASGTQGMLSAITASGNNLKFTNLRIVGFGTKTGREGFPMFLTSGSVSPMQLGNLLVEDCVFAEPATNNTDGTTVLHMVGSRYVRLTNAIARRCSVVGLKSYFGYSQATSAMHVENCTVVDCSRAVYFEPDPAGIDSVGPVTIRSNQFINVDSGVYAASHPSAVFDSILCLDNEIILSGLGGSAFAICDTCYAGLSGTTTNVVVLNNIIRYPNWGPRPAAVDNGLYCSDIQHAVFGNNVISLGNGAAAHVRGYPSGLIPPPPGDCDHPPPNPPPPATYPQNLDSLPPGYRRAWFGNRDIFGTLLPIRFYTNGAFGLAFQQQWAD